MCVGMPEGHIDLPYQGGTLQTSGLRFNGLNLPRGATIVNAYVQFTPYGSTSGNQVNLRVVGQAADNAVTFSSAAGSVSGRASTAAAVNWLAVTAWTADVAGAEARTPNISAVIQEIINRAGWAAGNSLALIFQNNGTTGNAERDAHSYESSSAKAATLVVDYVTGAPCALSVGTVHEIRIPTGQSALTGYLPAPAGASSAATDSDGVVLSANSVGLKFISSALGGTDNNYDFGFCAPAATQPCVKIFTSIACALPGNTAGSWGATASGTRGDTLCPAFWYRIVVTNCGTVALTNLTVTDDKQNNFTTQFFPTPATVLAPGRSVTNHVKMTWCADTTVTVSVSGRAAMAGAIVVGANDSAVAYVATAAVTCQILATSPDDQDGNPYDGHVTVPSDGRSHSVTFKVVVINNGNVPLANAVVTSAALQPYGCCPAIPFTLAAGARITNSICTANLSCADLPLVASVNVTATPGGAGCAYDDRGVNITASTTCNASVECTPPLCVRKADNDPFYGPGATDHALYLPGIANDFVFETEPGSFVQNADGTARLTGVARSRANAAKTFSVDITLSGRTSSAPSGSPKRELQANAYSNNGGPIDPAHWTYYTGMNGTLTGSGSYEGAIVSISRTGPAFQIGVGANGKNLNFGAASWFNWNVTRQPDKWTKVKLTASGQGDINVDIYFCTLCAQKAPNEPSCGPGEGAAQHAVYLPGIGTNFVFLPSPGSFTQNPDGTARLTGAIRSSSNANLGFNVSVNFSGFCLGAPAGSPKKELDSCGYVGNGGPINTDFWNYYTSCSGTLTGVGNLAGATLNIQRVGPAFQVGMGANGKNYHYGGSGWFSWSLSGQPANGSCPASGQGDINIDLNSCP